MPSYQQILLKQRPKNGQIGAHLFETVEREMPSIEDGEILLKQTHMSLDPAMIGWMSDDPDSYIEPVPLNSVMRSSGIATVVESKHKNFSKGDRVMGMTGWTEYLVSDGQGFNKVDPELNPETLLCVLALPGLTATQGLLNIAQPKAEQTLVVTGAAGSVGSIVGQIAKAEGLTVVGVVGSDEKAQWITQELGFDGAINYKNHDLAERLESLTPDGIDLFFENTGGEIQHHIFDRMNAHGRIIVCGLIADYTSEQPAPGPSWLRVIKKRLMIQGFTMPDHLHKSAELQQQLLPYVKAGQIKYRSHVLEGLESAKDGLNLFLKGQNKGKLLVAL
ncbi:NADP-dependent oxidoreductase [Gayadomonas joobiniege]|uniref:NADP-dependent oxidoreductase n=1 Tax=Gayadomonas joobiniege TaxID=1234606 RepID=UPI0003742734|nr:NADP-dependent oxidoreductase [Gayadomonas joobiniege]